MGYGDGAVPTAGFEPAACGFVNRCSFRLSYVGVKACPQADLNRQPSPSEGDALSVELQGLGNVGVTDGI